MFKTVAKLIPNPAAYAAVIFSTFVMLFVSSTTMAAEEPSVFCLSKVEFVRHMVGLRYAGVTQDEATVTVNVTDKIMKHLNSENEDNSVTKEKMDEMVAMVWAIPDKHLHNREFINSMLKMVFYQCIQNNSGIGS